MAEYQVGVHLTAHDETGPGTSSASAHLHGVEQSAQEANKQIEGMGPSASRGAAEASVHLNSLKNSLGEITRMAAGFALGGIMSQFGGGLGEVFKSSIDKAQEFNGQVKSLQMVMGGSAEEVSTTVSAFERFGVSSDRAAMSLSLFSRQIQKVPIDVQEMAANIDEATGKPLKGFAETMRNMGVSTEDVGGKVRPMMDIFLDTADAFQKMGNGGEAAAMATTLFGRAGRDMLPLLMQGKEGIKAAAEEAAKMGLQLTTTNMAQIKAYSNANKDLNEALSGLKLQIGIALMPVLTALAQIGAKLAGLMNEYLLPAIKSVSEWIGKLVQTVRDAWDQFVLWLAPLGEAKDKLFDLLQTLMDTNVGGQKLSDILTNLAVGMVTTGAVATVAGIGVDKLGDALSFAGSTAQTVTSIFSAGVWGTFFAVLVLIGGAAYVAYQNLDWFKDIVNALAVAFTSDAGALAVIHDVLLKTFGPGVADAVEPFLDFLYKAIPAVGDFGNALVEAFTGDPGALGVVYKILIELFGAKFADNLQPMLQWLIDHMADIRQVPMFLGNALQDLTKGDVRNFLIDLSIAFNRLTGIDTSGFAEKIGKVFDMLGKGDIKGAIDQLLGPLAPVFDNLVSLFDKISGALATLWPHPLKDLLDMLAGTGGQAAANGPAGAMQAFADILAIVGKVLDKTIQALILITGLFDKLADAVGNVVNFFKENESATVALSAVLAIIAGLIGIGIVGAIGGFIAGLVALSPVLLPMIGAFLSALPILGGLVEGFGLLTAGIAILGGPVTIIILLILGLAAALVTAYNTNEDFRNKVNEVWNGMKDWAGWLVGEFAREWGLTVQGFKDLVKNWDEMVTKFKNADFSDVGKAFEALGTMLSNALKDLAFNIGPLHWTAAGGWKIDAINPQDFQDAANAAKNAAGGFIQQNTDPDLSGSQSMLHPEVSNASGGWLREPVLGVGPSGTRYVLHANEFVSPAGGLAAQAAAAHGGYGGGGVNLNVSPGAVVINGSGSATSDIAAAADGLWDDLYAKLSRALDNRPLGAGA